jgi:hydrogenase expression/formation protein HypE
MCIRRDALPVYPLTDRMGDLLGIDPLGLIGSGSLLICCRPDDAPRLVTGLEQNDIAVTDIGTVTAGPPGIDAVENGSPAPWPRFDVDEITRLFA